MPIQKVLLISAILCFICVSVVIAQHTDRIIGSNIHSVKLHPYGDPLSYPILRLNSSARLELHFDDLDADVKYYSYTFILCNADWTQANLSQFDYMKGFSNVRINTYRNANTVLTRYTHYMSEIPNTNTYPTRSGNYILKVFLNGDTKQLAFTKRFLVVDNKASAAMNIIQPFNNTLFRSHQKVQFSVNVQNIKPTNIFQQIKIVILQNYRWDNAIRNLQPTFIKQHILEYNTENESLFPGQKEWRWVNLTSLRLQTDRIQKGDYNERGQTLYLFPDGERSGLRYMYYRDANGLCQHNNIEGKNPYWQSDYATAVFKYVPPGNKPYEGKDLFIFGEMTNYELSERNQMNFNAKEGYYENKLFLKQGYYDYMYLLRDQKTGKTDAQTT
ncbi:MAG: DUF5103 domain-containing protein, partial [Bacteroidota bacterium]